nr:immunoglobulin light chain junction region [Macaca mulatta]
CQQENNWSVTF